MTRDDRLAKLRTELHRIEGVPYAFILFADPAHPGRIVQIALGNESEPGDIEATNDAAAKTVANYQRDLGLFAR